MLAAVGLNENRQLGIGLLVLGAVCTRSNTSCALINLMQLFFWFGIMLFFDGALLAVQTHGVKQQALTFRPSCMQVGDLFVVAGLVLIIGPSNTMGFFALRER
jgi:hypothetical protein